MGPLAGIGSNMDARITVGDTLVALNSAHQKVMHQFEGIKRTANKYVQDFREGIFGLLGWKVDMKLEGGALRWTFRSCYCEGQELVFQLRAVEGGRPAEFDLLSSPWAEQLQADHQAMAYLEVHNSIPCFLAHITNTLLPQRTLIA